MEMKGRIVVYYVSGCPHCKQAKSTLDNLKLSHVDVNLERHPEFREKVRDRTSKTSVPQIFFNNIHIGGNDDLQALIADKSRWEALLQEILENEPPENDLDIPNNVDAEEKDQQNPNDIDAYEGHEEQNKHAAVVAEFRTSDLINKKSFSFFSSSKNKFSGNDLVKWIVQAKEMDEDSAKELATKLIDEYFFVCVKSADSVLSAQFKFPEDSYMNALNSGPASSFNYPAIKLAENLRKLILNIYSNFLSNDGKSVDYAGISGSIDFEEYRKLSVFLQKTDVTHLSREEKLAFFINIYNAMVIHANVSVSVPTNLLQRYKFLIMILLKKRDGILVSRAKEAVNSRSVAESLVKIKRDYKDIPKLIFKFESTKFAMYEAHREIHALDISQDCIGIGEYFKKRLNKNKDFEVIVKMTMDNISPALYAELQCCQPASAAVERSFSMLEKLLAKDRSFFFNYNFYIIGGNQYSLQDIENGVLRGNRKGVGMFSKPFNLNDQRLKVALITCEPRIHFALVCGAKSCPPIKTYSSSNIDSELEAATQSFLENDEAIKLNLEKNEASLSQIFKWYKEDFGEKNVNVLLWIHSHMFEGDKKNALSELIHAKSHKVSYQHYDWSINSK
ncbi:Glutaredoxin 1 [Nymphon striatum]|nr:Glutaredoxin 1 [Nymphon striatum]